MVCQLQKLRLNCSKEDRYGEPKQMEGPRPHVDLAVLLKVIFKGGKYRRVDLQRDEDRKRLQDCHTPSFYIT